MNNYRKYMVTNTNPGHIWFPNSFCGVCGEIVPREIREHCGELTIVHCGELHPLFNLDGKYMGFQQGSRDDNICIVKNGETVMVIENCL
jgi:hypothetical protein